MLLLDKYIDHQNWFSVDKINSLTNTFSTSWYGINRLCHTVGTVGLQKQSPGKCLGPDLAGLLYVYIDNCVIQGSSYSMNISVD